MMALLYSDVDVDDDVNIPTVMNGAGYLDFTELARMFWNNIRANWAITQPFYEIAPKFPRDLAFMQYRSLDYTGLNPRFGVSFLYLVGFLLLLKPTLHVFILVLWSVVT